MNADLTHKYSFVLLFFLIGCHIERKEEIENIKTKIILPDKINKNEKTVVRIFSNTLQWSIAKAYFDCDASFNMRIDTMRKKIVGCEKEFFVRNDTIIIQFVPDSTGNRKFHDIEILMVNKEKMEYKIIDTTFYYSVIQ